jgi:hypothetical protein
MILRFFDNFCAKIDKAQERQLNNIGCNQKRQVQRTNNICSKYLDKFIYSYKIS